MRSALRTETMINFRVTRTERDTMRRLAEIYGISMTALFRSWLKQYSTRKAQGQNNG